MELYCLAFFRGLQFSVSFIGAGEVYLVNTFLIVALEHTHISACALEIQFTLK